MSAPQHKRQIQVREGRLSLVAKFYRRGYSYRQIQSEVMKILNLPSYSLGTVKKDVDCLLKEWREDRVTDTDALLALELRRIDETVKELWSQWEKSKEDYAQTVNTRKGSPKRNEETGNQEIKTYSVEERTSNVVGLGNTAYISEIRQQLAERRKLLGLYAAEKKDISGELSFANLLVESGMLDDAEADINKAAQTSN